MSLWLIKENNMDLSEIRGRIDGIDAKIAELFLERMELAGDVARWKAENNMPVFQGKREEEILERMRGLAPEEMKLGTQLLFTNIMDISKCLQIERLSRSEIPEYTSEIKSNPRVACQGTQGSYSHAAYNLLFNSGTVAFYDSFSDVFEAVEGGEADYGILPIENSTAGEVTQTYELMGQHDFYISRTVHVNVNHVLAAKKGVKESDVKMVFSHEQALRQCGDYLRQNPCFTVIPYHNTASAAKMVSENQSNELATICSEDCARIYGLDVLKKDIGINQSNYTRFICISKNLEVYDGANVVTVSMSLPHTAGALYRLLTKFAVNGLNLTKIESRPLPKNVGKESAFDVMFYLDFDGSIKNLSVVKLLNSLKEDLKYFKFLGNYKANI